MTEEKVFLVSSFGEKISGIFVCPKRAGRFPVVILAHGFGSNKNGKTNTSATEFLTKRGVGVFKFDFSGHGESGGKIEELTLSKGVEELRTAYEYVISQKVVDKKRIGLLGISFGGNVGIIFASQYKGIEALALKSPVSNYKEVRDNQLGQQKIQEWKEKGVIRLDSDIRSNYQFYEDACKIDTYRSATSIKCPVYIVQGDSDEVIPLNHTKKLAKAFGRRGRFTIIKGADHSYSNRRHFDHSMRILNSFLMKSLNRWLFFKLW